MSRDGSTLLFFTITMGPSRSLYALRRTGGGGGSDWNMTRTAWTDSGFGFEAIACSANASVILVGTPAGITMLSRDSGANWTQVTPFDGLGVQWSTAVSADGQTLLMVRHFPTGPAIWRSTDGGSSWNQSTPVSFASGASVQDRAPIARISADGRAFAMGFLSSQLPVVSRDGGQSWSQPDSYLRGGGAGAGRRLLQSALPGGYSDYTVQSLAMSNGAQRPLLLLAPAALAWHGSCSARRDGWAQRRALAHGGMHAHALCGSSRAASIHWRAHGPQGLLCASFYSTGLGTK